MFGLVFAAASQTPSQHDRAQDAAITALVSETDNLAARPRGVSLYKVNRDFMSRSRVAAWEMYIQAGITDDPNFARNRLADVVADLTKKLDGRKPFDVEVQNAVWGDITKTLLARIQEFEAKSSAPATSPTTTMVAGMTEEEKERLKALETLFSKLLPSLKWNQETQSFEFFAGLDATLEKFEGRVTAVEGLSRTNQAGLLTLATTVGSSAVAAQPVKDGAPAVEARLATGLVASVGALTVDVRSQGKNLDKVVAQVNTLTSAFRQVAEALRDNDPEGKHKRRIAVAAASALELIVP